MKKRNGEGFVMPSRAERAQSAKARAKHARRRYIAQAATHTFGDMLCKAFVESNERLPAPVRRRLGLS